MLNKIWFGLLFLGIVYGFGKATYNSLTETAVEEATPAVDTESEAASAATPDRRNFQEMGRDLNAAALDAAKLSIEICIGLIGIMALWLGLLSIARDAGMVDALARLMRPMMRWLFPDVPDGHPAQGAILMNLSANVLGLDNAATPLGLKAMQELQSLNPAKDTATNAMAMFLAINTSSVTLVPFTIIGYRVIAGSENPAGPLFAMVVATLVTTVVAVVVTRLLSTMPRYAVQDNLDPQTPPPPEAD